MELRHLRYFIAIGEEQHYGRAARRLRVAQPALSRQVQDLEEELGFDLFDRLPRGVRLSSAGKLFLEDARRILQQIGEAVARAGHVASGRAGTLRLGFTENSCWRGVVPESFRRFRELQPDAELQLQPAASTEQIEAMRSGRLDRKRRGREGVPPVAFDRIEEPTANTVRPDHDDLVRAGNWNRLRLKRFAPPGSHHRARRFGSV